MRSRSKRSNLVVVTLAGVALGATGMRVANATQATPHAFIVAEVDVRDSAAYRQYATEASKIVTQFGGHYIVRGGKTVRFEGDAPARRIAIIEFPSLAQLEKFESSPEYTAVKPIRLRNATSRVYAVEGIAP